MSSIDHRGYRLQVSLVDIANLYQAVDIYRGDHGDLPTESQGLDVLVHGTPRLLERLPRDAWGNLYIYRRTPSKLGFEIHSAGRNGRDEDGAGDDVTSSEKAYLCEDYQVNCGMTSQSLWLLLFAAAFFISVGTLVFNTAVFLVKRMRVWTRR
ncbi:MULTISPECIES: type II secretion system protein GspG [unclassified Rhizobacter]|uniref:type II secretion system protein GspG n=1 Tax=unclassified Rhizobacter TaxID=2640088 RepID=UPI00138EDF40|nr:MULTISPECIES: type II secretion system protein GspG [unclassified Rhizobacter]